LEGVVLVLLALVLGIYAILWREESREEPAGWKER
jgi:hypothetical protein